MHVPALPDLARTDPQLHALIEGEAERQHDKLRMIPSENYVSTAVLEACASVLNNKYSEGYAGRRYYEPTGRGGEARVTERAERIRAVLDGSDAETAGEAPGTP